ncbi:MAG: hypothetical protein FH748_04520 [Balneolaceae bacterium]|nr:hypothetical protein [Balneolaceae bacterium]
MSYQRIVSLVPSLTELLFDLGFGDKIIGRTRFCIHPEEKIGEIPIIGGTKNPRIEKILGLKPDFILANKEENNKEDVEELARHTEVHVTDINTVAEAVEAIGELGAMLKASKEAEKLTTRISELVAEIPRVPPVRAAYFIWKDPWMTIGNDTYIHDVMQLYALKNVYADQTRYPKTSLEELSRINPELILLSSEPYPFKEKHIAEIREHLPSARIELVDGEWFSWYGSRMLIAFKKLNTWRRGLDDRR